MLDNLEELNNVNNQNNDTNLMRKSSELNHKWLCLDDKRKFFILVFVRLLQSTP